MSEPLETLPDVVARCELVISHAWMVRTFVKHSEEVEDYPELYDCARAIFDAARALETRVDDPPQYLRMLAKKLPKLRKAAAKFRGDAAEASGHMNWQQAVISLDACVADLADLAERGREITTAAV
ncbi:MAG: amidohydrolase [Planctomycetota bacterium]